MIIHTILTVCLKQGNNIDTFGMPGMPEITRCNQPFPFMYHICEVSSVTGFCLQGGCVIYCVSLCQHGRPLHLATKRAFSSLTGDPGALKDDAYFGNATFLRDH